jgi:hypothetical protein
MFWEAGVLSELADYVLCLLISVYYISDVAPMELVLTVGRHHAHGEMKGGWAIPDCVCRYLKADLFIKRYWKSMKQTIPT